MIRAFLRAPSGIIGAAILAVLFVIAVFAPPLLGDYASTIDLQDANEGPSAQHILGTDQLGRDIAARLLVATRLSIGLALAAAGLGALLGTLVGVGTSVLPPRPRAVALRAIDAGIAFPGILIAIFVTAIVGPSPAGVMVGVGVNISFSFARVSSTLAMSVGGREYVLAARVVGLRGPRLMTRYVLPNIAEVLAISTSVAITNSIVQVSSLSFLGLGVQAPEYDWGRMLTEGVQSFYVSPTAALAPAAAIATSALAFGLTGEAVARSLNPVLWTTRPHQTENKVATPVTPASGRAASKFNPEADSLLSVHDLRVSFPVGESQVDVVNGITFNVGRGEVLGIVGESGSGKSMTALAVAQLVPYPGHVQGQVTFQGKALSDLPPNELSRQLGSGMGFIFQNPMSSLNPALKLDLQLVEAAQAHNNLSRSQARERALELLREVNIPAPEIQMGRYPHELSGGMQQRVMIAMALMVNPSLVLADEPTTALDVTIQAQIMDLLLRINRDHGTAVILISHNLAVISQNCHRVIVMYAGDIVEELTAADLAEGPSHPYTRLLLDTVPDMSRPRDDFLTTIRGQAPDIAAIPPGCPFNPRCPLAIEKCRTHRPPLVVRDRGQRVACWVANEAAV